MEALELMDVYAMDRGIARLVSQVCHVELNPVANKQYTMLKLDAHVGHGKVSALGFTSKSTTDDVLDNIRQSYRRISDWHIYQHTLELIEELLVEFEATTRTVHSHDVMLECLSGRTKDELIFQKPMNIKTNKRTAMLGNYLASQINRTYSTGYRDLGFCPDSYCYLSDDINTKIGEYLKASNRLSLI